MSFWDDLTGWAGDAWDWYDANSDAINTGASLLGSWYNTNRQQDAMRDAVGDSNSMQWQMYNQTRNDNLPQLDLRNQSLGKLSALLGMGNSATPGGQGVDASANAAMYDTLRNMPGYQFATEQANKATDRRQALGGQFMSGRGLQELQRVNQGMADQNYNNYVNQLLATSGMGQAATQSSNALAGSFGNNISNNALTMGQANASAYGDRQHNIDNALSNFYNWRNGS